MRKTVVLGTLACALAACASKKTEGLPPAQEWSADPGGVQPAVTMPHDHPHVAIGAGDPDDPHAGVDMGPAASGQGDEGTATANPHAGVDMSGAGGVDVSKMGLAPPDPNRAMDPNHHIRGTIRIADSAKARAHMGGAIFLIAKRPDASGQPAGPPLAVSKLTWNGGIVPFELTDADQMIAGTELAGDVVLVVRYDQDGDALSKQPGDITGQLKLKVPADHADVVLDTVL